MLNNLFADGQTHASSRILLACVQPLEDHENSVEELGINSNTIVLHKKLPLSALFRGSNMDFRRILTVELDGIGDQVLKYLDNLHRITPNLRQGIMVNQSI